MKSTKDEKRRFPLSDLEKTMKSDAVGRSGAWIVWTVMALAGASACSASYESPPCPNRGSAGVTADPTICPKIGTYSVTPTQTQVGQPITLTATATSKTGDPLTLTWSASAGAVADASAANTTYRCTSPGRFTLTLTVSNGRCGESIDVSVECLQ
jgi:hypothetical protein